MLATTATTPAIRPFALVTTAATADAPSQTKELLLDSPSRSVALPGSLHAAVASARTLALQGQGSHFVTSAREGMYTLVQAREVDQSGASSPYFTATRSWRLESVSPASEVDSLHSGVKALVGRDRWVEFPSGSLEGVIHAFGAPPQQPRAGRLHGSEIGL